MQLCTSLSRHDALRDRTGSLRRKGHQRPWPGGKFDNNVQIHAHHTEYRPSGPPSGSTSKHTPASSWSKKNAWQVRFVDAPSSLALIVFVGAKEAFYDKPILLADRDMVEADSDAILHDADKQDVAFLVVGDPFGYVSSPAPL